MPALPPTDRCPGLLRPHLAADGAVVRVRLLGGRLSANQLRELMLAAELFGNGSLQLTSRGNLQLRGVDLVAGAVPSGLVDLVSTAGLLPSAGHERVRNFLCSPLTGLAGGRADLRPALAELDRLVCATPDLASLSGRFLFGLDDGRGDIAALAPDLGALVTAPDRAVLLAGRYRGAPVALSEVPTALVRMAQLFLATANGSWRVADTDDGGAALLAGAAPCPELPIQPRPLGTVDQHDGRQAISVLPPLGLIDRRLADPLLERASGTVILTPDRTVVVPDLPPATGETARAALAEAGWVTDPGSGWVGVSACTGAPGCASAHGDTAAAAADLVELRVGRVHVAGCERRCGAPGGQHLEVLLTPSGPVAQEVWG